MYPSDYGFATEPSNWSSYLSNYGTTTIKDNNWMYMGLTEWTITPYSSNSSHAFAVYDVGDVDNSNASYGIAGRPVLYLKADVTYVSGDGTQSLPYRIN